MNDDPTYEELARDAAATWATVQRTHAQRLHDMASIIAASPDVRDAPPIGTLYSHPRLTCPHDACGGLAFTVRQWGCVNGVRDKCTLSCQRCGRTAVYSWPEASWLH